MRLLFLLACSYLILHSPLTTRHSSLINAIPGGGFIAQPGIRLRRKSVPGVATTVFQLSGSVTVYSERNGSGDSTLDSVNSFCILVVAVLATIMCVTGRGPTASS